MEFDLKSWREALGLTQEGAATLLGVHRVTYTRWETGAQSLPKLVPIGCQYFNKLLNATQGN